MARRLLAPIAAAFALVCLLAVGLQAMVETAREQGYAAGWADGYAAAQPIRPASSYELWIYFQNELDRFAVEEWCANSVHCDLAGRDGERFLIRFDDTAAFDNAMWRCLREWTCTTSDVIGSQWRIRQFVARAESDG